MNAQTSMQRTSDNRMLCGMAGGVAEYLDVDAGLVRLAWVGSSPAPPSASRLSSMPFFARSCRVRLSPHPRVQAAFRATTRPLKYCAGRTPKT
jgi:hypothetical protein